MAEKGASVFQGMSSLRAEERRQQKAQAPPMNKALQDYLMRNYQDNTTEQTQKRKVKKKKPKSSSSTAAAITIVDEDSLGTPAARTLPSTEKWVDEEPKQGEDSEDDYKPVIANEAEAKYLFKQIRKAEHYYAPSQDGSGWTQADADRKGDKSILQPEAPIVPDASPPRRGRHDSPDASPPRIGRHDSPDASLPRRSRHDSPDAFPPRRSRHNSPDATGDPGDTAGLLNAREAWQGRRRMLDGTAAGLVNKDVLKAEMEVVKRDAERKRVTAEGRGAETVYRDRASGRIVDKETFLESRRKGKKEKSKEEIEAEQFLEWRSGLAQKRAAQEKAAQMVEEAKKPFARYDDDEDRDAWLKDKTRFGDPMAHLVSNKRKRAPEAAIPDAVTERYDIEALQKSGFQIPQEIPPHSWIKRGAAAPSNRYNIRPGRHWDGVDRSNGFERDMFKYHNTRNALEHEARMWSMSDM